MANAAKLGTDLSLEEALEGWSTKARTCFESLKEAVRIDGSEWAGIVSALGRTPVPILNIGEKNICQVHPDGNRVVIKIVRGEDVLKAVNRNRKLPARVKRAFSAPGKINFLAEGPVTGAADARAASSILAIKAACMDVRIPTSRVNKRPGRKSTAKRKSV